jgi:aspartate--ammonia ligase
MNDAMTLTQTEIAIKTIKDTFERALSEKLNLLRVSAPLFVETASGLNDRLNGTERPVAFEKDGVSLEIVQSLAKWKRVALHRYGMRPGEGLYTDMNAIRMDETVSPVHSLYVDQWDWEKVITKEERTIRTLMDTVKDIHMVLIHVRDMTERLFGHLVPPLPEEIVFVDAHMLKKTYPRHTVKEREDRVAKEHGAVFIVGIGERDDEGLIHDGRSPDYDDWSKNGDLIVWNPVIGQALELSSMGIRVDAKAMREQLGKSGTVDRSTLPYHRMVIENTLPQTIGGGIGQSRMCMFFLGKRHIGEVQSAWWPGDVVESATKDGIFLL